MHAGHSHVPGRTVQPLHCAARRDLSAAATNRLQLWIDGVQIVPSVAATFGTTLTDALAYFGNASAGDSSTFNITANTSHGMLYFCPLPSLADRARLRAHKALK